MRGALSCLLLVLMVAASCGARQAPTQSASATMPLPVTIPPSPPPSPPASVEPVAGYAPAEPGAGEVITVTGSTVSRKETLSPAATSVGDALQSLPASESDE